MFTAFIVTLGLLVYAWILYPAGMLWRGRRGVAARSAPPAVRAGEWPSVSILFSAHNEEAVILKRLENLAALDYPPDKIQI
jgi:cellulose synthase/poly-beta-1,6-N-acetylglucosamine synthase-like glycosyltransferase